MAVENRKKKKNKMSVPLMIVLVICVVVLGVSIWQLSGIFIEYKKGTDEYDKLQTYVSEEPVEEPVTADTGDGENEDGTEAEGDTEEQVQRVAISELQAQNSDTVGWIQIPGTQISYPLMHTSDDSYYLNHTFSKKLNSAGSIFVETLNNGDFSDLHTIIYGHNMKNGSMFAGLKEYSSHPIWWPIPMSTSTWRTEPMLIRFSPYTRQRRTATATPSASRRTRPTRSI